MKIAIIGVGNIGMRYYQGISSSFGDAVLYLVDQPARLQELGEQTLPNAILKPSIESIDADIDLFIVSTSCTPRLTLYEQCLARKPAFVILDKYLFASRQEFSHCLALERTATTFVNQWMYGSGTFDCMFDREHQHVELRGAGWGLGCNAVHWIDVFKRHLGIADLVVGEKTHISAVFPAKRPGYEEIAGCLVFKDRHSDKTITLIDRPDDARPEGITIRVDQHEYLFNYREVIKEGVVLGSFPYFSAQIGGIVGDIMTSGQCTLPSLDESISQHLLIEDVLASLERRPRIT